MDDQSTERNSTNRRESERPWIWGAALVILGIIFLLRNTGIYDLDNWWALFILIPAVGAFSNGWNAYRNEGRLSIHARGSLLTGFIMLMLAAIFLFNLNWAIYAPALILMAGIFLLVNALLPV